MATSEIVKSEEAIRQELSQVQFQAIQIVDQQSYDRAAEVLIQIKGWRNRWRDYWYGADKKSGPVSQAHSTWKSLLAKFNEADESAEKSEAIVKAKILAWDVLQEEKRRKAQEEADRIAREKEAAERAVKVAELEVLEVDDADIEAVLNAPSTAVAEVVQPTYQRVSSISKRDNWCAEVTDLKALFKALGAAKFKLTPEQTAKAKEFFESLLKKQAEANTSTLNIPGVTAVNRPIIGARTR